MLSYELIKQIIKNDIVFYDEVIDELSKFPSMLRNEAIQRLHTPWIIKYYIDDKWPNKYQKTKSKQLGKES
jgi:phage-related protein